jgi:signal transduction histidine kinase
MSGSSPPDAAPSDVRPRDADDAVVADAAGGGEQLVARIRLWVAGALALIHFLTSRPEPPHPVRGPVVAALVYSTLVFLLVRRRRPRWFAFTTSGLDVTFVTAALALYALNDEPYAAVNNTVIFDVYFVVIAVASLRFDWPVSAFSGIAAILQYTALVAWTVQHWSLESLPLSPQMPSAFRWPLQGARLALLVAATVVACAGVVRARLLRSKLGTAVLAAERHERAREVAVLEERQRLSRDLHDSVTQLLFSVTLVAQSIGSAWRRDPREGEKRVQRLLELTQSALREMRALVADLRPNESILELIGAESALVGIARIREHGLAGALRRHAPEIGADGLALEVEDAGYEPQRLEHEEVLYRIAVEALANVSKHAHTRSARVILSAHETMVSLSVVDAGRGFDAEHVQSRGWSSPAEGGYGLVSMRERVEAARGVFRIASRPGGGTVVSVELPRDRKALARDNAPR